MTVEVLAQAFTVCKLTQGAVVPSVPFCFTGRTDAEFSLVCPTEYTPAETIAREDGWRALRVSGSMPFALVGVLSRLSGLLAAAQVPVFAVSTFDTDYLLIKAEHLPRALHALSRGGIAAGPDAAAETLK